LLVSRPAKRRNGITAIRTGVSEKADNCDGFGYGSSQCLEWTTVAHKLWLSSSTPLSWAAGSAIQRAEGIGGLARILHHRAGVIFWIGTKTGANRVEFDISRQRYRIADSFFAALIPYDHNIALLSHRERYFRAIVSGTNLPYYKSDGGGNSLENKSICL
jgi:hypothetical protein